MVNILLFTTLFFAGLPVLELVNEYSTKNGGVFVQGRFGRSIFL